MADGSTIGDDSTMPGHQLPYNNTRVSRREAGGRLPNAPARPSAEAASDLELIRLWLSGKSPHTRRAYEADLEEFVGCVDKPLQAVLPMDW